MIDLTDIEFDQQFGSYYVTALALRCTLHSEILDTQRPQTVQTLDSLQTRPDCSLATLAPWTGSRMTDSRLDMGWIDCSRQPREKSFIAEVKKMVAMVAK